MNNIEITKNWKQLLILAILSIGIILGIYLVKSEKVFKSKASSEINSGLKVSDDSGVEISDYQDNTYYIAPDTTQVKVSIKNLQELISR